MIDFGLIKDYLRRHPIRTPVSCLAFALFFVIFALGNAESSIVFFILITMPSPLDLRQELIPTCRLLMTLPLRNERIANTLFFTSVVVCPLFATIPTAGIVCVAAGSGVGLALVKLVQILFFTWIWSGLAYWLLSLTPRPAIQLGHFTPVNMSVNLIFLAPFFLLWEMNQLYGVRMACLFAAGGFLAFRGWQRGPLLLREIARGQGDGSFRQRLWGDKLSFLVLLGSLGLSLSIAATYGLQIKRPNWHVPEPRLLAKCIIGATFAVLPFVAGVRIAGIINGALRAWRSLPLTIWGLIRKVTVRSSGYMLVLSIFYSIVFSTGGFKQSLLLVLIVCPAIIVVMLGVSCFQLCWSTWGMMVSFALTMFILPVVLQFYVGTIMPFQCAFMLSIEIVTLFFLVFWLHALIESHAELYRSTPEAMLSTSW